MTADSIEIDVADVAALRQAAASFLLLDCREPDEHAIARIAGATLIPLGTIPERLAELEPFQDRRIVVYCHHGVRSLRAARYLRERGFSQAQSMSGGIEAWAVAIDPAMPRY